MFTHCPLSDVAVSSQYEWNATSVMFTVDVGIWKLKSDLFLQQ